MYLHQDLKIKATGAVAASILKEIENPVGEPKLTLFLSGVAMKGLPTAYWVDRQAKDEVTVQFTLQRNPANDDSREAWNHLLEGIKSESLRFETHVALAVGRGHPLHIQQPIEIGLRSKLFIRITTNLCLLAFLTLLIWLGIRSNMLKDGGSAGTYSLGRTQMAFWGLLVLFSWVGTSFITRCMEHVPKETLILLGISASTGLSALAVGDNQKHKLQTRAALEAERKELLKVKTENMTQAQQERLAQISLELAQLPAPATGPKAATPPRGTFKKFLHDLCSDEHGLSFHRLQVVLWTIALGCFFAWRVTSTLSMPAFSDTLLILMGISNGTYLGFKFTER